MSKDGCPTSTLERFREENERLEDESENLFRALEGLRFRLCKVLGLEYTTATDESIFNTIHDLKALALREYDDGK